MQILSVSHVLLLLCAIVMGGIFMAEPRDPHVFSTQPDVLAYDMQKIHAPLLAGTAMKIFVSLSEIWPFNKLIGYKIAADSQFTLPLQMASQPTFAKFAPTFYPLRPPSDEDRQLAEKHRNSSLQEFATENAAPNMQGFRFSTIDTYAAAYRQMRTNPKEIAQKVLAAIGESDQVHPPLRAFIRLNLQRVLDDAQASAERFKRGKPLSIFDGVPIGVKDEFDVEGFVTGGGTRFIQSPVATADSEVVARLRSLGAIIVGKTNMHECGVGVTGMNPNFGFARNPYNISHVTGGSSSGSGAAVAAGIVPVAVGSDGGGSIRIPSGLCGVVGIKSTFGRISSAGEMPLAWTLASAGPLAATVRDAALSYLSMAGPDSKDANSLLQPLPHLADFGKIQDLSDLRIGVYWDWARDSSEKVFQAVNQLISQLSEAGAEIVDIIIPNLNLQFKAHSMSIVAEFGTGLAPYLQHRREFAHDTRVVLATSTMISSRDYIACAKIRSYSMEVFSDIFKGKYNANAKEHTLRPGRSIDLIITPATAIPAPHIPPSAIPLGHLDTDSLSKIMRFVSIPNFTGQPAIVVPIAYTHDNLPISVQFIADFWKEHVLFRAANFVESITSRNAPERHYKIL